MGWGGVQVREYDVDYEDEFAQCCWEEGRDESWKEEDHGEDGLDSTVSFPCTPEVLGVGLKGRGCGYVQ